MRRVRRGSLSSELPMCGGGVRSILLLPLVARCLETTSRLSGNHLEDDGSSACVLSLACIRSSYPS